MSNHQTEQFNEHQEEIREDKTEQYECPSYFDDSNTLKDCTCGKCV